MALLEIKEVLRHWLRGRAKRLIARRLGLDVKTVRKYVRTAEERGLTRGLETALTDEVLWCFLKSSARCTGDNWVAHVVRAGNGARAMVRTSGGCWKIGLVFRRSEGSWNAAVCTSVLRRSIVSSFLSFPMV
jgi:hypothetical protein